MSRGGGTLDDGLGMSRGGGGGGGGRGSFEDGLGMSQGKHKRIGLRMSLGKTQEDWSANEPGENTRGLVCE